GVRARPPARLADGGGGEPAVGEAVGRAPEEPAARARVRGGDGGTGPTSHGAHLDGGSVSRARRLSNSGLKPEFARGHPGPGESGDPGRRSAAARRLKAEASRALQARRSPASRASASSSAAARHTPR